MSFEPVPVSANSANTTMWESDNLSGYKSIVFYLQTNTGLKVQLQSSRDGINWNPNGNGQDIGGGNAAQDATTSTTPQIIAWPNYDPWARLQILSGTGVMTGLVYLNTNTAPGPYAGLSNQNWQDASMASVPKTSTLLLASNPGVRVTLIVSNSTPDATVDKLHVSVYGSTTSAVDGAGSFILDKKNRTKIIHGVNFFRPHYGTPTFNSGPAPRGPLYAKTDANAANLQNITVWYR